VDSKTSANAETKASYQWRDNVTCVIYYVFVERRVEQQNVQALPTESAVVMLKYPTSNYAVRFTYSVLPILAYGSDMQTRGDRNMSTGGAEVTPICHIWIYIMHMKGITEIPKKKKSADITT